MGQTSEDSRDAGQPRFSRAGLTAFGLLGLAHAPLLVLQARSLWGDPQYRDFPLVLAGSTVLAIRGGRHLGRLEPGGMGGSRALVALALMLLGAACLLFSPWLGALAAMATLLAATYAIGGRRLVVAILPAWCFLGLCFPPPFGLEEGLISGLQDATARCVNRLLDVLGIYHVMEGYVIDIAGRRLMVEEACSGIHSLLAGVTCTLFFALWMTRSLFRTVALLLMGALWVLVGNVLRIVAVAVLYTRWRTDWSEGWRHELLGLIAFVVSLGLIYSTDCALDGLTRRRRPGFLRGAKAPSVEVEGPSDAPTRFPALRRTWLGSPAVLAAFGLLGLLQIGLLAQALSEVVTQSFTASENLERRFAILNAESLPERFGPFDRVEFAVERRAVDNSEGAFSHFWRYEFDGREVVASIDYPLRGWHELTECFRRKGWVDRERSVRRGGPSAGGAGGDVVEVALVHRTPGRYGYLVFCNFDRDGRPLDAEQILGYLRGRLRFWAHPWSEKAERWRESQLQSIEFQVFVESEYPLTRRERDLARAFFDWVRSTLPVTSGGRNQRKVT